MNYEEIEQKYKTRISYPTLPKSPAFIGTIPSHKLEETNKRIEATYKETSNEYKEWKIYYRSKEQYRLDKFAYQEDESNKLDEFKRDALEDVGLLTHPKADKIYAFAWEHGHSSGLYEVYHWLQELADLLL